MKWARAFTITMGRIKRLIPEWSYVLLLLYVLLTRQDFILAGRIAGCQEPEPPLNGKVSVVMGTPLGDVAVYSCDDGFTLIGQSIKWCVANNTWEDSPPICEASSCGPLNNPDHGTVRITNMSFGALAAFECDTGYMLAGSETRTCQTGEGWSGTQPDCVDIVCSVLEHPENGKVDTSPGRGYLDSAAYTCSDGYELVGSNTRVCQSNGQWGGSAPECTIKDCGPLTITGGTVAFYNSTTYQSVAVYSCNHGYYLMGDGTRFCADTGWSGLAPSCLLHDCGPLDSPLNGAVEISVSTSTGQVATYVCNEGYLISGSDTRHCGSGTWEGVVPNCIPVACDSFTIPFGDVEINGTGYGSVATVTCHHGYSIQGSPTVVCQSNNIWSSKPVCEAHECGYPGKPENGILINPAGTTFGQTASYTCEPGFTLVGTITRHCTSLGWNGTLPSCRIIGCEPLPNPQHGSVVTSGRTVGQSALYSCSEGYKLVGLSRRTCGENGTWTGVAPVCNSIDCGPLNHPKNGTVDTTPGTTFKKAAAYTCKAGFRLLGTNVRICDRNGNWTDTAPACVIKDCKPLNDPVNGMVDTSSGTTYGQFATYRCHVGFVLIGPRVRSCTDMGYWSGSQPNCVVKNCTALRSPGNGKVNITGTSPGDIAIFSCDSGYRIVGEARLVCGQYSEWDYDPPICLFIDCRIPRNPDNGYVSLPGGTLLGDLVYYHCEVGYRRIGSSSRMCSQNGNWTGVPPHCDVTDCGSAPSAGSGSVVVSGTTFGNTARYMCERGYQLVGLSTIQCLETGWSDEAPSCTIVTCDTLTAPANGFLEMNSTTFDSRVIFGCSPGFELSGNDTSVCMETGVWSQEPTPTCEIVDCGPLENPSGGLVDTTGGTTFGSTATYSCLEGYNLNGTWISMCSINSSWEGAPPTCQPVDCDILPAPIRGLISFPFGTTFGKKALYSCEEGYYVDGPKRRECQANREWSGSTPFCRMHDCKNYTTPTNGRIITMTGTTYGETIQYSCDTGYDLIGADTITCGKNGRWTDSAPLCTVTDCGSLASPGNGSVSTTEQTTTFGQVATFTCHPGYNLIGDKNLMCKADGNWTGAAPVCQVKDCGPLSAPTFGSVKTPLGTSFNKQAIYSCEVDGYELVGSSFRVCLENETWSEEEPVCTLYDCRTPDKPTNGVMAVPLGTRHGAVATFYCNYGYRLTGSSTRTCVNGNWTGLQPECIIRKCSRLFNPDNGIVNVLGDTYQSSALYTCLPGYDLEGSANRTCLGNGSWSDTSPVCVPKDCRGLDPPTNGAVVTPEGTTYGKTATYICDTGHTLIGMPVRYCLGGGAWSLAPPICKIQDCGPLSHPANGKVDIPGDTTYGQIATYSCFTGYDLQGQGIISCQANGNWSGSASCRIKNCEILRSVENGKVDISSGTTYTSIATYSCNIGYRLIGGSTRLCQATGSWSGTQPSCAILDCGGLSHPANGVVNFPFGTTYGETLIYTCNPGYKLLGDDTRLCEVSESWSGEPPVCAIKDCDGLDSPVRGSVNMTGTTFGNVAIYTCDKNYEISGVENRQCMSDGQWSAAEPSCVLEGDLKAVEMTLSLNASIGKDLSDPAIYKAYEETAKEMLLRYYREELGMNVKDIVISSVWRGSLNVKYELIISSSKEAAEQLGQSIASLSGTPLGEMDNNTVYATRMTLSNAVVDLGSVDSDLLVCLGYTAASPCEPGYMCILRNSTPACVPDPATDCGPLSDPENGSVDQSEGTTYGKVVTYTCDPGHSLQGYNTRLCQTDSSWTSSAPMCLPLDCRDPVVPVNGVVLPFTQTTVGTSITYRCNQGFSMSGQSEATCLVSGNWSISPPTCIQTSCETIQSPSSGNLKIEFGALGITATYTCQDGYDLIGTTTRVCTNTTRSWTGSTPVCAIKNCGPLFNPAGGVVDTSEGMTYGSVATYSCTQEGYRVLGDRTRLCGVSGFWSGSQPVCVPKECSPLSKPFGGNVILLAGTDIGSTARYTCNLGFQRSGPEILTCGQDGKWSDTPPTCISLVNCPVLSDPEQGSVSVTGYYQGATAIYRCKSGYRLVGSSGRTCLSSEAWSPAAPTCEIEDCGPLTPPVDGFVNLTATTYGNTATFTCQSGYGLVGMATVLCLDTGEWSDTVPRCVPDCPTLVAPENGKASLSTGRSGIMIVTFTCNLGYDLVGEDQRVCQRGAWTASSPICIAKDCGPLANITNGRIGSYNSTNYGQSVTYYCDDGYALEGSKTVVCLDNSTWSPVPTCNLVDCGPPDQPVGGVVVVPFGFQLGQVALYSCKPEFVREGPAVITCLETGSWSHNTTCKKIDCGPLAHPTNGEVAIDSNTMYNSRATYSCNLGYRLTGGSTRICTATGWSGISPVCALIDCDPPDQIANGQVIVAEGTTFDRVATYSCDYSHALVGVKNRKCLSSGNWSDENPTCEYFECRPLEHPQYGHVNTSRGTAYGEVAVYSCNQGYYIDGESRRQCQISGSWSGSTPSCKIHDCGPLGKPENGEVSYSGTTYGAMATYKCDATYSNTGDLTRTCDETGKWTGSRPRCDSQREFALALGLGLGVGFLLILVMVTVVVIILLYRRHYAQHLRESKRKTSYYNMYDYGVAAPTSKYGPLYLGQEVYSVYPAKPTPSYATSEHVPSYSTHGRKAARPRHPKPQYPSEVKTYGQHSVTRDDRSAPSQSTHDRRAASTRSTREDRLVPSHSTHDRTVSPTLSTGEELSYGQVEKIGRQDYLVPYLSSESRPTTATQ